MAVLTATLNIDLREVCLRLLCAMIVGMVIGIEREHTHRPAGMRTHILVALGSCVVMIIGNLISTQYQALGSTPDPTRLGAQVISGISFLGAGTILREGVNVKGLTTAASLWTVACLGLAAGAGYYVVAIIGMLLVFVTLSIFEVFQRKLFSVYDTDQCYCAEVTHMDEAIKAVAVHAKECKLRVEIMQAEQAAENGGLLHLRICMNHGKQSKKLFDFCQKLILEPCVRSLRETAKETVRQGQKSESRA